MGAEKINVRSYCLQKYAAVVIFGVMALNIFVVLKPYFVPPLINCDGGSTNLNPIIFNYSNARTDAYDVMGDVRIHGRTSTIFIASTDEYLRWDISQSLKPHPRKYDPQSMSKITEFKIKVSPLDMIPRCTRSLDAPAVLFSTGGHVGNHFHRLTDVLVPLYATSHHFHRRVYFLVTNRSPRFTSIYREAVDRLSENEIRDVDGDDEILCFPRMMIGLKAHIYGLAIDPTQSSSLSMRNFTKLMRDVYSLQRASVREHSRPRPRMLVVARRENRKLTNAVEVVGMARSLGFDAFAEDFGENVESIAKVVNAVDVMVGVHGAGLTNMVFLPENAVIIQILPLGLAWYGKICYGRVQAKGMNLKYLEYKVRVNESSLEGKYPSGSQIYEDEDNFCANKGSKLCKKVYLDDQDVNLDLQTFQITLLKALELLKIEN